HVDLLILAGPIVIFDTVVPFEISLDGSQNAQHGIEIINKPGDHSWILHGIDRAEFAATIGCFVVITTRASQQVAETVRPLQMEGVLKLRKDAGVLKRLVFDAAVAFNAPGAGAGTRAEGEVMLATKPPD